MGYDDYKYYKPTLWDKICIETTGWLSLILLFLGIWIAQYRWRLIFTSLIVFIICVMNCIILKDKNDKAKECSQTAQTKTTEKKE